MRGNLELYQTHFVETARVMSSLGAHTKELAEAFEVREIDVLAWRSVFPEFNEAIIDGGKACDDRVRDSLYKNATGYVRKKTVHTFYKGSLITKEIDEHVQGDVRAQQYWLNNRDPDNWSNTQRIAGADGKNVTVAPIMPGQPAETAAAAYAAELEGS